MQCTKKPYSFFVCLRLGKCRNLDQDDWLFCADNRPFKPRQATDDITPIAGSEDSQDLSFPDFQVSPPGILSLHT